MAAQSLVIGNNSSIAFSRFLIILLFMFRKFILFFIVITVSLSTPVFAEEMQKYYDPVVDVISKPGNQRVLSSINFMVPLRHTKDKMWYSDMRVVSSDRGEFEGNIGFGYRQTKTVFGKDAIVGGYGFFDRRRSRFDHYFSQFTLGAELLTEEWAARINGYKPQTGRKILQDNSDTATLTPQGFVLVDLGLTTEQSLPGYDLEIGKKIPLLKNSWLHAGFYHFGFRGDDVSFDGFRVRAYTDVTDWLRIGGEASHDAVRGDNQFAEIRIRIPLQKFKKKKARKYQGIYKYMMEPVVRDVDIVTRGVRSKKKFERNANGKKERYYFVDNTAGAGGDGRPSNPFNTLAAAEAAAPKSSTIFVRKGDGTTANMDAGISLNNKEMRLIGSGIDLRTRKGVVVEAATVTPHITNTGGDAVVVGAKKVEVAGFAIDSPLTDGIFVLNVDKASIHDNTVTGAGNGGIHALYTVDDDFKITLTDNVTNGNMLEGTHLRVFNGAQLDATITNTTSNGNINAGIRFEAVQNSQMTATVTDSTTNGNGSNAGLLSAVANSADFDITVKNHTANSNVVDGVQLLAGGSGKHNVTVQNSSMDGNGTRGLNVDIQDSSTATVDVTDNIVSNNTGDGFILSTRATTNVTGTVRRLTSTGSGQQGVEVVVDGVGALANITLDDITVNTAINGGMFLITRNGADADILLTNSTIDNNTGSGLFINAINTSILDVEIENTTISNATVFAVQLDTDTTGVFNPDFGQGSLGSVGNNRIFGGTLFDVWTDLDGGTVTARNNWWGVGTGLAPAKINHTTGGSIDASNFLTVDPGP